MFYYNNRLCEQYNTIVESLVVFGDDNINWRPNHYSVQGIGITKDFTFPVVKLLDYRQRWSELEADRNPFATVVMVHLRTLETTGNWQKRKEFKLSLMKRLYEQGFERQDIINLYSLIDWMMTLTSELQVEFNQEITQYEEKMKMPYITSIERIGEQRGELRGKLLEAQQLIMRLLKRRVGEIETSLIKQVETLALEPLEELGEALLDFSNVTDLEEWLASRPKPVEP